MTSWSAGHALQASVREYRQVKNEWQSISL